MGEKKKVEVVAALIWRGSRFMACKRPPEKARGLLWEFVGGKVEPGETKQQALARECKEELDIEVVAGSLVMEVTHDYPDIIVHLSLFESYILSGKPKLLEHCDLQWITPAQVDNYEFCPADKVILDWLKMQKCENLTPLESAIRGQLFSVQDMGYQKFHSALMPAIPPETVIGVRMPQVKKLAKQFAEHREIEQFLNKLPHRYYEENNLHGALIAREKNYTKLIEKLDHFLPYVNNWATCDSIRPQIFKKHPAGLEMQIECWLKSDKEYTVRFALEMLMTYYLDEAFKPTFLERAAQVKMDTYYVQMMQAWYFATALAKQWEAALPFLSEQKLPLWVHNKTIQKAIESNRLSKEQKAFLKTLKRIGEKRREIFLLDFRS